MCNTSRLAPHSDRFHTSSIQRKKKRWGLGEEGTCHVAVLAPMRCSQGPLCLRIWPRRGRARKASLEMGGRRERERHRRGRSAAVAGEEGAPPRPGGMSVVGHPGEGVSSGVGSRERRGGIFFISRGIAGVGVDRRTNQNKYRRGRCMIIVSFHACGLR